MVIYGNIYWLVVWNIAFIFHNKKRDVILPIDFHIFQYGYCTTNQEVFSIFFYSRFLVRNHPLGGEEPGQLVMKNIVVKPQVNHQPLPGDFSNFVHVNVFFC